MNDRRIKPSWVTVFRILFVASAVFFGWWTLREEWPSVVVALQQVTAIRLLEAAGLVIAGLLCTGTVWLRVLRGFGYNLPALVGLAIFFVGQLGKYIPGSVWSLAAQGQMARRFSVPVRATVATGLIFLYLNIMTAVLLSASISMFSETPIEFAVWLSTVALLLAALAVTPNAVSLLANALGGASNRFQLRWPDAVLVSGLMLLTWSLYGFAVAIMAPRGQSPLFADVTIMYAITAFTIAFVLGILVPLAPAGFGVREGLLIVLLTPVMDIALAAAIAILTRVIHLATDFGVAAGFWSLSRIIRR